MMNRAALFLQRAPGTMAEKAARYLPQGASVRTMYAYAAGTQAARKGPARQAIEDAGGPACAWWDEPVAIEAAAQVAPEAGPPPTATPESVADEADLLLGDVQRVRASIAAAEGGDPNETIRNLERCARMLQALQALRGVLTTPRQLLASPHWRRIAEAVDNALTPWPDAKAAVRDALVALDGEPE